MESNKREKLYSLKCGCINSIDKASRMCLQLDNVTTSLKCKLFSHNTKSVSVLSSVNQVKVELIFYNAG